MTYQQMIQARLNQNKTYHETRSRWYNRLFNEAGVPNIEAEAFLDKALIRITEAELAVYPA